MLELDADITTLRGAAYNPRQIAPEDLEALRESIQRLGLVKPLIVRGDLLVAGHQRTRALRTLGITRAPVYRLGQETTTYDEVRFNQLHNGTDLDAGDEAVRIAGTPLAPGYQTIAPDRLSGNFRGRLAVVRAEIADLILKYGPWGAAVATVDGEVLHGAQYALAAVLTGTPLTLYGVPAERSEEYRRALNRPYGVFNYEGITRETYIQTFAQMMRLRAGPSGRANRSTLYETLVMPWLRQHREARGLDFGSGQGDYARLLRSQGYPLEDLELFRRRGGSAALDLTAIHRMIDQVLAQLATGPYDYLVADSVLNSVDCREAETAVMATLNGFCRVGGTVFLSGRKLETQASIAASTRSADSVRRVEFLDSDGFTALYRRGRWFFQKYHDAGDVEQLCEAHGFQLERHERRQSETSWQAMATKVRTLPLAQLEAGARYEFDLPLSETRRLGRHEEVLKAMRRLYGPA